MLPNEYFTLKTRISCFKFIFNFNIDPKMRKQPRIQKQITFRYQTEIISYTNRNILGLYCSRRRRKKKKKFTLKIGTSDTPVISTNIHIFSRWTTFFDKMSRLFTH